MTEYDSGGIQPLRPDGSIDTDAAIALEAPKPRSRRGMWIAGILVSVLAVGAIGAVIAWRTLVGSAFASAEAVPIDADFVMTFDLLQVRDSEQVDRLIKAFTVPAAEQGMIDEADVDVLSRIDEELDNEIGMTLADDVVPWIGRSVSFAVWLEGDFTFEDAEDGMPEDFFGGVLVAGVRDGAGADRFIDKMARAVARENDGLIESVPFREGTLTAVTWEGDFPDNRLLMWLDGDMMIMGIAEDHIAKALDAREGQSIADHEDFDRMMGELPSDRLVAMYVGTDWLADLYDDPLFLQMGPQAEAIQDQLDTFSGFGMSFTLLDEGVAFDMVYASEDPEALGVSSLDASDLEFLDRLPDDTLFHAAFPIEEDAIANAIDQSVGPIREEDPDFYNEMVQQADDFLGVSLFEEVLPALGREAVLAVVPTPEGLLWDEFGIGVGGVFAIGVEDRDPVAAAIDSLEDVAVESGVSVRSFGDVSVIGEDGRNFVAYSLSGDTLAVGTGPTIVDAAINGVSPSVEENPRYQELDRALIGSGVPIFLDIQGIFDVLELEPDQRALVDALQAAGASGDITGDLFRFSALLTIDY